MEKLPRISTAINKSHNPFTIWLAILIFFPYIRWLLFVIGEHRYGLVQIPRNVRWVLRLGISKKLLIGGVILGRWVFCDVVFVTHW